MKKTRRTILLLLMLLLYVTPVMAAPTKNLPIVTEEVPSAPVEFSTEIYVDADGGRFEVGFVEVEFKKDFIDESWLPVTFTAEVFAEDGQVFIEFLPDTPLFYKQVHLRVDAYEGYIYDRATDENIYVNIKKSHILAPHFSRYCVNY